VDLCERECGCNARTVEPRESRFGCGGPIEQPLDGD